MMLAVKFLVGLAPPFEIFQTEYPMVHCLHTEMRDLLVVVMKLFLQSSAVDGKCTNGLLNVDVAKKKTNSRLIVDKMDFGEEADTYLQNEKEECWTAVYERFLRISGTQGPRQRGASRDAPQTTPLFC